MQQLKPDKLKTLALVLTLAGSGAALGAATPQAAKLLKSIAAPVGGGLAGTLKNWGLVNTHKGKSHIGALDAWRIEEGSRDIKVAIIDTGIDATHKDLAGNVWQDPAAAKGTKVFGWDYVTNKANPLDSHGHGTHVAGIVGAIANPKTGVAGVAQRVSMMAVKYYSDANPGSVNLRNTIDAIDYAVQHGARIINYSGGGPEYSQKEYDAIKKAEAKGVLFVAAAGNEHQDTDLQENYYYPAAYRLTNIISVAATDIQNQLLPSSNWGKTRVDVAAPGENIFSTLPGGRYGTMSGTSQATAFVTGLAALMLSRDPSLTPAQIKELILKNVDQLPHLKDKLAAGGRINAYSTLLALVQRGAGDLASRRPVSLSDTLTPRAALLQTR